MESFRLVVDKKEEKDTPYLDIDYQEFWFGKEFVITGGC